jgi:predicted phage terminase large subunit-like protein
VKSAIAEAYELERKLSVLRAQRGLLGYLLATDASYTPNWHHRRICQTINAMQYGLTHRQLLHTWGYSDPDISHMLARPHEVTGLYAGMTDPSRIDAPVDAVMIALPPRHGKLLADDTLMLTPDGWRTHGELEPGDLVYGANGQATRVMAVSAPGYASLRVALTNGQHIDCHPAHLWTVYDRSGHKWKTLETAELLRAGVWSGPAGRRGSRSRFQLPAQPVLDNAHASLPIDPYTLGLWLGDGTSDKPCFTHSPIDSAVLSRVARAGYGLSKQYIHRETGVVTSVFGAPRVAGKYNNILQSKLQADLQNAGVWRDKHVPVRYLLASIDQRLQLMAGLVDSDGHVCRKTGRIRFVNTKPELVENVAALARTLGARAYITVQKPALSSSGVVGVKTVYTANFNLQMQVPCELKRKREQKVAVARRIGIVSVAPIKASRGRCIAVDAPDGLYLAGAQLTPTHNSRIASIGTPAWWFGKDPDAQMISVSYSADLAARLNREIQREMDRKEYIDVFPQTRLSGKNIRTTAHGNFLRNSDLFEIVNQKGIFRSAGVAGGVTGMGFSLGIIDDSLKNRQEADSAVVREGQWEWFGSTFFTRRHKGAKLLSIATSWHEDDLNNRLRRLAMSDPGATQWFCLIYPGILDHAPTPGDIREQGEAMWPLHFPLKELLSTRATIGTYEFEALYQQRPAPREGGIIKTAWLQYYTRLPDNLKDYTLSADLTFGNSKAGNTGDFVAIQMWAADGAHRFLVDQIHGRMEFTEQLRAIKTMCAKYSQCRVKLIEDAANGRALISLLRKEIQGLIAVPPSGSKSARLEAVSPQIEAGNVYLPSPDIAPWVQGLVHELASFPNAAHDDQVDAMSQGLWRMRNNASYLVGSAPGSITRASPWLG